MAREAAPLLDRFNRPLFPGVRVEFHSRLPMVYSIADLKPVVDPRQPAGLWQLTLSATVTINAFGGSPIEELTGVVFPKAVEADRKPDDLLLQETQPRAKQDNDSPAGLDEYHPPGEPEPGSGDGT